MRRLIVEADGGSRGNPGPAAYGAVVVDAATGEVLVELGDYLGTETNNVAEYEGVTAGLAAARRIDPEARIEARLDSKLVVEQLSGGWAIKNARLRTLALRAKALAPPELVTFTWVPRAQNKRADALANESLDAAAAGRQARIERWRRAGDDDIYVEAAGQQEDAAGAEAAGAAHGGGDPRRGGGVRPGPSAADPSAAAAAVREALRGAGSTGTGGPASPAGASAPPARPGSGTDGARAEQVAAPAAPVVPVAPAFAAGPAAPADPGAPAVSAAPAAPGAPEASAAPANKIVGWARADLGAPTTLVLVRHGVTQQSLEHRFSGLGGFDPPLVELGRRQAEAAAEELARRGGADVLVCSPLQRTRQTAAIIAERLGLADPVVVDGLAEADFGEWDSLTFAEVKARWPEELAAWLASTEVAPPGGESFAAVRRRVDAARAQLLERFPRQRVLAVSHVTPIKVLVQMVLDAPAASAFRFELAPCSLTTLAWWADGPSTVFGMGERGHLHGVLHETA